MDCDGPLPFYASCNKDYTFSTTVTCSQYTDPTPYGSMNEFAIRSTQTLFRKPSLIINLTT